MGFEWCTSMCKQLVPVRFNSRAAGPALQVRLFDGLREEGWESDKINEYTASHLHKVNQALA